MNYADSILWMMDDRIDSAIKKQIMPGSRFWNKNLAEQKEMIKRIKSLKKEELYRLLHERKLAIWPINPDFRPFNSALVNEKHFIVSDIFGYW